jgi:hypothetical protein
MNIVERAKSIILKPKEEWNVINQESSSVLGLLVTYLIPLAIIPAIAAFIGYGIIGVNIFGPSLSFGIKQAIVTFVTTLLGVYISAYIIDNLAPNFGSSKNFGKAFQLVVYSFTPVLLAGAFQAIPALGILAIVGLYGLYLLWVGLKPMMKTLDEKVTSYFIVSILVIIAVYAIIVTILTAILIGKSYGTFPQMR